MRQRIVVGLILLAFAGCARVMVDPGAQGDRYDQDARACDQATGEPKEWAQAACLLKRGWTPKLLIGGRSFGQSKIYRQVALVDRARLEGQIVQDLGGCERLSLQGAMGYWEGTGYYALLLPLGWAMQYQDMKKIGQAFQACLTPLGYTVTEE